MGITAVIPARLASTRFPRKVLAAETGLPLVVHVCRRAAACEAVGRVVVATDAEEVADAVRRHGFDAVPTSPDHPNGTSRVYEAARALNLGPHEVIVNVQGDEPELDPGLIAAAVEALRVGEGAAPVSVGTVASPFSPGENDADANIVKAVTEPDPAGPGRARAVYFSRAPVPFDRDGAGLVRLKHVGLYAYRLADLAWYVATPETSLEAFERLEQLRWLAHGRGVGVAVRAAAHHGVDTPEQYAAFVRRWRETGRGDSPRAAHPG